MSPVVVKTSLNSLQSPSWPWSWDPPASAVWCWDHIDEPHSWCDWGTCFSVRKTSVVTVIYLDNLWLSEVGLYQSIFNQTQNTGLDVVPAQKWIIHSNAHTKAGSPHSLETHSYLQAFPRTCLLLCVCNPYQVQMILVLFGDLSSCPETN